MERRDIRQVTELLQKYLKRFQLAPSMGEEEVAHWFFPQDNIIDTYVVEVSGIRFCLMLLTACLLVLLCKALSCLLSSQGAGGVLTDFASFYTLPSTVMHHPLHRSLKAAYSFYNVHTQTPLLDLMNDALILAKMVMSPSHANCPMILKHKPNLPLIVLLLCNSWFVHLIFYFFLCVFNRKVLMFSMPWI